MSMSANQQRQCLQLVWRSGVGACLKVSAHIRVPVHEGGFVHLIRIRRRKQGSRVTVMRQEDWRHFSAWRMTAAVFRPHHSEAFTRDLLMTNHLLELSPNGRRCLLPVPELNLKQAPQLPAAVAAPVLDTEFTQQVIVR